MRTLMDTILKQLKEFFGRLSKKEKRRLGLLAVVIIILGVVVTSLLSRVTYADLYTNLAPADSGEVVALLNEMGVPYKLVGTGTIRVPEKLANETKVRLASEGILSDSPDLSILESANGFSVTESSKKDYAEFQYAQTIRQHLLKIAKIQNCSVIINLGEVQPFVVAQQNTEASASIMLTLRGGGKLSNAEVNVIADIIRTSVPGVKYENISITDSMLYEYTIGESDIESGSDVNSRVLLENQLKQQAQDQVLQLLTPMFGMQNIKVQASIVLDFDKEVSEHVVFEPPIAGELEGIARSVSEMYENQRVTDADGGVVGTDANGMGTPEYPYGELEDGEEYKKSLVEKNYEINETTTRIEKALGTVKSMTISVLLDSEAVAEDYTVQVRELVSMAIGVHEDNVAVVQAPFVEHGETIEQMIEEQEEIARQIQLRGILEMVLMWGVILLLGLSFLSLIRMIIRNIGSGKTNVAYAGVVDLTANDSENVNNADIDLSVKPSNVEQLERFIDKDSKAVAQLLRNWLTDD